MSQKISVQHSLISGHNIQIGAASGNVIIHLSHPEYRLEWLLPTDTDGGVPEQRRAPSHLLDAARAIVPFHPRPEIQDIIYEWCKDPAAMSVLLVHGPGGEGKTRMANQLAGTLYKSGWAVAQAIAHHHDEAPVATVTPLRDPRFDKGDLLVAIDYADRWPTETLGKVIRELPHKFPGRRIRALLLARSKTDLWLGIRAQLFRFPADLEDPVRLGDLYENADERAQSFAVAVDAFQQALALRQESITPPTDLLHPHYGRALTLQMRALASVCAHRDNTQGRPTREELSAYLLEHEIAYWHTQKMVNIEPSQIGAVVFYATSFGPVVGSQAAHRLLIEAHLAGDDAEARKLLEIHERIYPPAASRPETHIPPSTQSGRYLLAPLRPDRLGEDYVAQYLEEHERDQDHFVSLLTNETVLSTIEPIAKNRCLTLLANAADRHPAARDALWSALRVQPMSANAPCIYAVINHGPRDLASLINDSLIDRAELQHASRDLARHLLNTMPSEAPPEQRARLLYLYGVRALVTGDKRACFTACQEATHIYRGLAKISPRRYEPKLADCLAALGASLSVHDGRTAIAATKEADRFYRKINTSKPSDYLVKQQARNLSNLSALFSEMGDYSGAVEASEENVRIIKALMRSSGDPKSYRSVLARSLYNLGLASAAIRDAETSLNSSREAVRLYRELDSEEPGGFRPQLAASLHHLGIASFRASDKVGALDALDEAVRLRRKLAKADPDAYRLELARSLEVAAGVRLNQVTRMQLEVGAQYAAEATMLYEQLMHGDAGGITSRLRAVLSISSMLLEKLGQTKEARETRQRARQLAA
jgi:tetratricopeptide (TPR) repeat protein